MLQRWIDSGITGGVLDTEGDRGCYQDWTNYAPGYPFNTEDASRGWNLGDQSIPKHGT